jgi:hypothetical protein
MRSFFRHIRTQPKEVRDRYAFGIASVFTAVVLVIWAVARFDAPHTIVAEGTPEKGVTMFSTLFNKSKEQLASLKSALSASTTPQAGGDEVQGSADATTIVLTPEEVAAASEKAASNTEATSTESFPYTEVLIGTTSVSVGAAASSTRQ